MKSRRPYLCVATRVLSRPQFWSNFLETEHISFELHFSFLRHQNDGWKKREKLKWHEIKNKARILIDFDPLITNSAWFVDLTVISVKNDRQNTAKTIIYILTATISNHFTCDLEFKMSKVFLGFVIILICPSHQLPVITAVEKNVKNSNDVNSKRKHCFLWILTCWSRIRVWFVILTVI